MQGVHTFILKMLVNHEAPGAVIGSLQTIPERELYPFRNPGELLALLDELTRRNREVISLINKEEEESHAGRTSLAGKPPKSSPRERQT